MEREISGETNKGWVIPFLATVFAMMTLQMSSIGFSPLLPAMQNEFGMSYSQIGLFTGMYGLLAMIMSIPGGMLAKRFGEKNVLATGMLVVAVGLILLSQAPNAATAFAGRAFWLVGYRPAFVCVMTAIALTAPASFRSRSMGAIGAISAFGAVVGAPFGSTIGGYLGWRFGVLAFSGMIILGCVIFWFFYRTNSKPVTPTGDSESKNTQSRPKSQTPKPPSAFRMPIVWALSVLVGMVGVGQFSSNFFVPSAVETVFKLEAQNAAYIISTGYGVGIFANLFFGYLMDRFNKWNIMALLMAILIPASLAMTTENLLLFRIATATVLALGLTAAQQGYSIAGDILSGRETGNVMGVVAVGTGIFGYFGPQMLGLLRDWTGGFNAGWYLVTAVSALALILIIFLKHYSRAKGIATKSAAA